MAKAKKSHKKAKSDSDVSVSDVSDIEVSDVSDIDLSDVSDISDVEGTLKMNTPNSKFHRTKRRIQRRRTRRKTRRRIAARKKATALVRNPRRGRY